MQRLFPVTYEWPSNGNVLPMVAGAITGLVARSRRHKDTLEKGQFLTTKLCILLPNRRGNAPPQQFKTQMTAHIRTL